MAESRAGGFGRRAEENMTCFARTPFAAALSAALLGPALLVAQSDSVAKLKPVLVTVTRADGQSILRSPFALTVSQPDSARPGQRHTAIDETLAMVPGLSVTNRNNASQDPRLSIRGFGA